MLIDYSGRSPLSHAWNQISHTCRSLYLVMHTVAVHDLVIYMHMTMHFARFPFTHGPCNRSIIHTNLLSHAASGSQINAVPYYNSNHTHHYTMVGTWRTDSTQPYTPKHIHTHTQTHRQTKIYPPIVYNYTFHYIIIHLTYTKKLSTLFHNHLVAKATPKHISDSLTQEQNIARLRQAESCGE